MNDVEETWKKSLRSLICGLCWEQLHSAPSGFLSQTFSFFHYLYILSLSKKAGLSIMVVLDYCLSFYYPETIAIIIVIVKKKIIFHSWLTVLEFVTALMRSWYLSGVLLLPCSFISNIISEESSGELALASRRSCSCWARYWAGVCLANRAQWSSSLCSRGRLAFSGKNKWDRHLCIRNEINHSRKVIDFSCWCKCREEC